MKLKNKNDKVSGKGNFDHDDFSKKNTFSRKKISIFLIIFVIIVISCLIFKDFYTNSNNHNPGVLVVCTYKDELIDYHFNYNNDKRNYGSVLSLSKPSKKMKEVTNIINEIDLDKEYENIEELVNYINNAYTEAGAKCESVEYDNYSEYSTIIEQKKNELYSK